MPPHARGPNDRDGGDPRSRTVGIDHLTLLQVSPPELVTIASETGFDAIGIRVATAGPGEEPWPPFYALEVVPSITFTYGGLRSDLEGRVLDHDNVPVSGLWVGGVDAGGLSNWTYAGGLAAAYFTGRRAGMAAARQGVSS